MHFLYDTIFITLLVIASLSILRIVHITFYMVDIVYKDATAYTDGPAIVRDQYAVNR